MDSATAADLCHEVADPVSVDGVAEADFRGDLVALGHGHLAHVVAEAREPGALHVVPAARGAHPGASRSCDLGVLPVADDDLPGQAHARVQEAGLAVPVGGLVQVHEIHVDLAPGQVPVELGVEMRERLAQGGKAADPHAATAKTCASKG